MATKKDPKLERAGVRAYNTPKRLPKGSNKEFIVVAKVGDKTKIIRFGDPNMRIRKNNPAARKSFRARHKCDTAEGKNKLTARYWSCQRW